MYIHSNTSESQIYQEEWVLNMLKGMDGLFFIEVGAYNGIENSNTYLLENKYNWKSLLIEPNPKFYKQILVKRNSKAINVGISTLSGKVEFLDEGQLGGMLFNLLGDVREYRREAIMFLMLIY